MLSVPCGTQTVSALSGHPNACRRPGRMPPDEPLPVSPARSEADGWTPPKPRIPPSTLVDLGSRSGLPDGGGSISAPIHSAARNPDRRAENPPHRAFGLHGIASKKGYDAIPGRRRLSPNHCSATLYRSYCIGEDSSFPHSPALTPSLPGTGNTASYQRAEREGRGAWAKDASTAGRLW